MVLCIVIYPFVWFCHSLHLVITITQANNNLVEVLLLIRSLLTKAITGTYLGNQQRNYYGNETLTI